MAGLFRHLYVDTCPPSLQSPEIASVAAVQRLRPAAAEVPDADPPEWLDRLDSAAIVYLTMGTVWNRNLDIFRTVIEAVRDEDIALIVTVGRQNDPASLGPQPDNVLVHRYIPQGVLLPRCDAVITHGGAGTTLGALAFGVPLLLLPQGADQYANAERVVAAGAGRQLLRDELSVDAVRDSVRAVLDDASYRRCRRTHPGRDPRHARRSRRGQTDRGAHQRLNRFGEPRDRAVVGAANGVRQERRGLEVPCLAFFSARFSFSDLPAFFD